MNWIVQHPIAILVYLGISYLVAEKIGKHRTLGFWNTLLLCIALTPFLGFLIAEGFGKHNAKGCKWCGNKYNEAEYCGLCGKNDEGETEPGFVPKNKQQRDL